MQSLAHERDVLADQTGCRLVRRSISDATSVSTEPRVGTSRAGAARGGDAASQLPLRRGADRLHRRAAPGASWTSGSTIRRPRSTTSRAPSIPRARPGAADRSGDHGRPRLRAGRGGPARGRRRPLRRRRRSTGARAAGRRAAPVGRRRRRTSWWSSTGSTPGGGSRWRPGTVVVGRAPGCDIVLARHDAVDAPRGADLGADGEVTIDDLESHNGTWVGGEAVLEPVPLAPGRPLRLGRPRARGAARSTTTTGPVGRRPAAPRPARPAPSRSTARPARRRRRRRPTSGAPSRPEAGPGQGAVLAHRHRGAADLRRACMYAVMGNAAVPHVRRLLTPVMGIGNAIDAKRKGRRSERGERERVRQRAVRVPRPAGGGGRRRAPPREHVAYPDPAEIVRRVDAAQHQRCGSAGPAHADFLQPAGRRRRRALARRR